VSSRLIQHSSSITYILHLPVFLLQGLLHFEIELAFLFHPLLLHVSNYAFVHCLIGYISFNITKLKENIEGRREGKEMCILLSRTVAGNERRR
jgi:hypothetical protein